MKKKYYCDGICEKCDKGKYYKGKDGEYYTCNPKKIKGLQVIAPIPPFLNVEFMWCRNR